CRLSSAAHLGVVPGRVHSIAATPYHPPAIHDAPDLASQHPHSPHDALFISDRGTCSIEHIARLHRNSYQVLCAANWKDYRAIYDAHADRLDWQQATFLSIEQQRRRRTHSPLPHERYEIAVLKHTLIDPTDRAEIPARLLFVYSSADERACREHRAATIAKIRAGLEELQAKVLRGHPQCTTLSIANQINQ